MNQAVIIAIIMMIFLSMGCKSNSTDPAEQYVTGTVIDSLGNPVQGAHLNFSYRGSYSSLTKASQALPTIFISVNIPSRGFLELEIENYIHTPVRALSADTVDPGIYKFGWDGKDDKQRFVYSDCYWVNSNFNNSLHETRKILFSTEQHLDSLIAPFAETDQEGKFSIPFSRIPLNELFVVTNIEGDTLAQYHIGPKDLLYAFNETSYGYDTVTYSSPHDLVIKLSNTKSFF